MSAPLRDDGPPLTEKVNAYDEAHFATYLRLLDADAEGRTGARRPGSFSGSTSTPIRNGPGVSMTRILPAPAG